MKLSLSGLGKKQMIGFAVAYLITILFLAFLVKGKMVDLRTISAELFERKAEVGKVRELIDARERHQQEIVELESRIEIYEDKLPEQKEVPRLFRELDEIAGQSQIEIISVGPEESEENLYYYRYWRRLELEGGYHELGYFINRLEKLDRFIKVDDLWMGSNPNNPRRHNIKLTVSTFVSKEAI